MTPWVNSHAMLDKMIAASREFCYYSSFAGPRWDQAHVDLWRLFFGEDLDAGCVGMIYPFMYLYTSGYRPLLVFREEVRQEKKGVEETVEELVRFFWQYMEVTPEVHTAIARYVRTRAGENAYRWRRVFSRGMMLWRVAISRAGNMDEGLS
ncbi:MAG: hypothetical protein ACUVSP_10320 [Desulfotomaculales bacterium]